MNFRKVESLHSFKRYKIACLVYDIFYPRNDLASPRFQLIERLEVETKVNSNGGIELDYELYLDLEEFESLQLPEISHGRYLHDFKVS